MIAEFIIALLISFAIMIGASLYMKRARGKRARKKALKIFIGGFLLFISSSGLLLAGLLNKSDERPPVTASGESVVTITPAATHDASTTASVTSEPETESISESTSSSSVPGDSSKTDEATSTSADVTAESTSSNDNASIDPEALSAESVVSESETSTQSVETSSSEASTTSDVSSLFNYEDVPNYIGNPYFYVNNNVPFFTEEEITTESFEYYSPLDELGRCGYAMASIGTDLMPTEERGAIGHIKPTGWHSVKYAGVEGNYLYNRCHLIGFQLAGENDNELNLITGTRYLNVDGMLPFENQIARYVEDTGDHVMYRVTPIFVGDELVARGVLMEAESVEDYGMSVQFCVFCYNVQPGVEIDYATGESTGPEFTGS